MSFTFHIFLILLLSTNVCFFSFAESSGHFRRPVSGNDARITEMQSKLLIVQTDIINLSAAIASGDRSSDLRNRLTSLESQFQSLTEKLADERRQDTNSAGKHDMSIAMLTTQHDALQKQLSSLQQTIADKIKMEHEKNLPNDIQDAIRTHKFKYAEEKLIEMADNDKIQGIVHAVYANSIGNFNIILDFSKALTYIQFRLAVVKALRYEATANGHRDPFKLIAMLQVLQNSIVSESRASENEKVAGNVMINETLDDLRRASGEIFKNAMYSNTYAKNAEIERLSDALNAFRADILEEVMLQIVDGSFTVVASDKILENLYSHRNISQSISGMVALFYKLESTGNSNNETMINMGDYLKQLQERDTYKTVSSAQKESMTAVIAKLPMCVRSIFFESKVCFHSRGAYVNGGPSSNYEFNDNRQHVHLWFPGYAITEGGWKVTRSGDKFYFENVNHSKDYLYSGDIDYYGSKTRRFIYGMKIEGEIVGDKGAWKIELNGDYCYLKNIDNNEYMFATFQNARARRRFAFTWVPGTEVRKDEFQWQLKKC